MIAVLLAALIVFGSFSSYKPFLNQINLNESVTTCKKLSLYQPLKIWVVDRCKERDHSLSNLCSKVDLSIRYRLSSIIPVISDEGIVFENKFCAWCNKERQFRYLPSIFKCRKILIRSVQKLIDVVQKNHSCTATPIYDVRMKPCQRKVVPYCPENYTKDIRNKTTLYLCKKMNNTNVTQVFDGSQIYTNKVCCKCWNETCSTSPHSIFVSGETPLRDYSYILNFNEWEIVPTMVPNFTELNISSNGTFTPVGDKILFYTSFLFTFLSITSLATLIIIYLSNEIFNNFGGHLTVNLSTCQLIMSVMTILPKNYILPEVRYCRIYAIIHHYIALTTFMWMAIYALDLLQTFGWRLKYRKKKKSFKVFLIYCLGGFGLPALVVATAVIIEYSLDNSCIIRPRYGGVSCWFTSKVGGIVWYFGPICVLLTWNSMACAAVLYKLYKSVKDCRVVRRYESKGTPWLCVRMTSVFGVGYILQTIAVLSEVQVFITIGSLVNCLQGCLLVYCFVWTKKMRSIITSSFFSIRGSK